MPRTTVDVDGNALERVRKWAPKTRTGCTTCRKRRVKCDEAKPRCRRCDSIGVVCGGYTITIHEFSAKQQRPPMFREPADSPAPMTVKPSPRDMHIFDLLRTETTQQLVGPFDHVFWNVNVLQAMRQYPAIWHACLALAATHKQLMISFQHAAPTTSQSAARSGQHGLHVFSLQQYDRSVKSIVEIMTKARSQLTEADKEAVLLAAVMFMLISSLRGDIDEAKVHARHCSQLFHCWRSWERARGTSTQRKTARVDCLLLEEQVVGMVAHFESQFPDASYPAAQTPYRCGTRPLVSAVEAYYEFMLLLCELNAAARRAAQHHQDSSEGASVGGPEPDDFWHYRTEFCAWQTRFHDFRLSGHVKNADRKGIRVLELLFMGVQPVLAMGAAEIVRSWDEHHARIWDLYRRSGAIIQEEDAQRGVSIGQSWDSEKFIFLESCPATSG
ncbi:C6 zinc finger domain protein [Akanthomyces lecanii RCEF 1005]|uniref:C6 zinc finger domain protein n=1 Tax=Akanthomyces lecanii RCEF 1005 TaxID=1081108 RepID=A0A162IEF2_CORDF|nr:C6 zinc finger domain protein [Akanthomyces lecanii RCEF 1005]